MQVNQKDWSCPKKQRARWETIISQYRSHFAQSVPEDQQYWTMCGQCSTPSGEPLDGCEPMQLIHDGLIAPAQFRGVEDNPEIHELNITAFPELTFINDDFYRAMVVAQSQGEFNPGIVNADLVVTPEKGGIYVSKLLSFLTDVSSDILFIANMILRKAYYEIKDGNYVMTKLNKYPQFRYAMSKGNWQFANEFYEYNGAGNTGSRTYMGSFIFVKN